MTLGEQIRAAREGKNWTRAELGRQADISGQHVGNIEDDLKSPTIEVLGRIASALGVDFTVHGNRRNGGK